MTILDYPSLVNRITVAITGPRDSLVEGVVCR